MELRGENAIVTGAGSGIGRAIAVLMAREGASVVVNDINMEKAEAVAGEITSGGGGATAVKSDVTSAGEIGRMVKDAVEKLGGIDILVNNAGGSAREKSALFHELPEDTWDWVLDVNLKGVFICSRAVIGHMIENRRGKIVNIASIAAMVAGYKRVDYASAKGGVISFTRALARGVGEYGITVNCVSPGAIETEGVMPTPEKKDAFLKSTCLKRNGTPGEVAELVLFLVSGKADFITGQNYIIDGGRSLNAGG